MLAETKDIFIIGIKGAAMSNLAVILKQMGYRVAGCDVDEDFITDPILREFHIPFLVGFDEALLPEEVDLVVFSAAHGGEGNGLVLAAKKRGIRVCNQAQLLAELMKQFKISAAVSGCHGKTTTSSLLAYSLKKLKANPSYLIGAPYFNGAPGGGYEKGGKYFVIEADEYGVNPPTDKTPKLLYLEPTHIICTNIDFDHPDVYTDINETKDTFLKFFKHGRLFLCGDDINIRSLLGKIEKKRYHTFGFSPGADLQVKNPVFLQERSEFDVIYQGTPLGRFSISLHGEKNISNAAGVILLLLDLGFKSEEIKEAIKDFAAVKRRFELVYQNGETYLFDDYGHHPTEIAATIDAAKSRFKDRRIVILFQPHTYSRTQALKREFAESLSKSDFCLVAPIFPSARENVKSFHVTSSDIEKEAHQLGKNNVKACVSKEDLLENLRTYVKRDDVVFTIGAGDIYKLKDDIIQILSSL